MKRASLVVLILIVCLTACGKKGEAPTGETSPGAEPAAGAPTANVPTEAPTAMPDIPADQTTPENALMGFFSALNVTLDQSYQAANRTPETDPAKAKKYQEARARLRLLFMTSGAYTEICAYLDLIQVKKAEIVDKGQPQGDKAKLKVKIIKGDNLSIDPMSFGEKSKTEATVTVEMMKKEGNWKIDDFGGLVAKAKANRR
jgi:predicted small lipoprotein YifL